MHQRGFAPTLIILIIAVAALSGYFVWFNYSNNQTKITPPQQVTQPKPIPSSLPSESTSSADISNWKIYTNTNTGYTLKYPSDYSGKDEGQDMVSIMSPLNPNRGKGYTLQDGELKIEIGLDSIPFSGSVDNYIEQTKKNTETIVQFSEFKKVVVNGMESAYSKSKASNGGESYSFIHNNHRLVILKFPLVTSRQNEFDQILSSFKFLP